MPKYEQVMQNGDDFSDWRTPRMTEYKLACCDCGLVHDMEFRVMEVVEDHGRGWKTVQEPDDDKDFVVQFRAKRNERSTGQNRRWNHK